MKTLTLIAAAVTATTVAIAPTAHAEPTTLDALCAAQAWPRPVPDVIWLMFDPSTKRIPAGVGGGPLACWDDVRTDSDIAGFALVTEVSPPPGTLVARDQPITVALTPMDYDAPETFRPCDWVSASEVADIFDIAGPIQTDGYMPFGTVAPHCIYRSPGNTAVATTLYSHAAFPIDARTEYSMYSGGSVTEIADLGLAARCNTGLHGTRDSRYNDVVVLLDGNRLLKVDGLGAQPCDQLATFARTAIGRL